MLTLLLTADALRMGGIEAGGDPAGSEKWGVGHPRAAGRYPPPHPHFYPSRKTFFLSSPNFSSEKTPPNTKLPPLPLTDILCPTPREKHHAVPPTKRPLPTFTGQQ
jgi:hypothetical protein